jgi:ABC-type sulfate transport system permease subunit
MMRGELRNGSGRRDALRAGMTGKLMLLVRAAYDFAHASVVSGALRSLTNTLPPIFNTKSITFRFPRIDKK